MYRTVYLHHCLTLPPGGGRSQNPVEELIDKVAGGAVIQRAVIIEREADGVVEHAQEARRERPAAIPQSWLSSRRGSADGFHRLKMTSMKF